jgi:menaquinone-dependent protoporphyrinogen oxidase
MQGKVLIAYATKYGSTREIAGRIGELLTAAGLAVDIQEAGQVGDLAGYGAVVLGSAVYAGHWRKEAAELLEKQAAVLAERPVWLFSSGPTGEGNAAELMDGWLFPENLQETAERIQPQAIVLFHGVLQPDKMNLAERLIVKSLKAPTGDFRDWDDIEEWAGEIAEALKEVG